MEQKIIRGIGNLDRIIQNNIYKKLFLVIDSSYQFLNIKEEIEKLPVEKVLFSDFTPNPLFEQVSMGIDLLQSSACDAILAIGGGSAIDVAKCIKLAYITQEGKDSLIPPSVNVRLECDGSILPLIAIPTTAGTGSESTHNAVMYYEGAKQTVTNYEILPDYAILEPSVLKTLPLYQKKCTMMDALCQGIESWWSVNATEESKGYSKKAVELIMLNWRAYIFDNDGHATEKIMIGANYAGKAINIAQTTAAHAMSYKITSMYGLPHGHAVAVCIPEIWQYMIENPGNCAHPKGWEVLSDIFNHIAQSMGVTTPAEAIATIRHMMSEMELNNPSSDNKEADLEILSHSVNPIRLKNNPISIDEVASRQLYEKIVH